MPEINEELKNLDRYEGNMLIPIFAQNIRSIVNEYFCQPLYLQNKFSSCILYDEVAIILLYSAQRMLLLIWNVLTRIFL